MNTSGSSQGLQFIFVTIMLLILLFVGFYFIQSGSSTLSRGLSCSGVGGGAWFNTTCTERWCIENPQIAPEEYQGVVYRCYIPAPGQQAQFAQAAEEQQANPRNQLEVRETRDPRRGSGDIIPVEGIDPEIEEVLESNTIFSFIRARTFENRAECFLTTTASGRLPDTALYVVSSISQPPVTVVGYTSSVTFDVISLLYDFSWGDGLSSQYAHFYFRTETDELKFSVSSSECDLIVVRPFEWYRENIAYCQPSLLLCDGYGKTECLDPSSRADVCTQYFESCIYTPRNIWRLNFRGSCTTCIGAVSSCSDYTSRENCNANQCMGYDFDDRCHFNSDQNVCETCRFPSSASPQALCSQYKTESDCRTDACQFRDLAATSCTWSSGSCVPQ